MIALGEKSGMNNYSIKAISIGFVFNLIGGFLLSMIFTIIWSAVAFEGNIDSFESEFLSSMLVRVVMLLIGIILAFCSGYLCAHIARDDKLKNAIALGVLITLFAAAFIIINPDAAPLWSQVLSLLLFLPLAYAGGKVKVSRFESIT